MNERGTEGLVGSIWMSWCGRMEAAGQRRSLRLCACNERDVAASGNDRPNSGRPATRDKQSKPQ